jgi:thymidylate synthase ThyX
MLSASVIADSVANDPYTRCTTFVLNFPRFILAQFNTHRAFSRNTASSRAIPTKKLIAQVEANPYIPKVWGVNKPGMFSDSNLEPFHATMAEMNARHALKHMIEHAKFLAQLGVHKQIVNRYLEPFMWVKVIMTTTKKGLDNFFSQRLDHAAQPEMQELAQAMKIAYDASTPTHIEDTQWHFPFGLDLPDVSVSDKQKIVVARIARVSYDNHNGIRDVDADIKLADRLAADNHWSPFEHVAMPWSMKTGNLDGWMQLRHLVERAGWPS